MSDWPTCSATLGDGRTPCRTRTATRDGELCAYHLANPPAPPVAVGDVPEPEPVEEEVVDVDAGPSAGSVDETPAVVERIDSLRAALRQGLLTAETGELISDMLLDGLRSSKDVFTTCPACKHRHPVTLPDLGVRVNAASRLVEEIEGKLREANRGIPDELEAARKRVRESIESASDADLDLLLAGELGWIGEPS